MGDSATVVAAPQHLRALEHANRVRLARAELKRKIGDGKVAVADVLASPPHEVRGMSISELLMSQRRWGRARCRRLLLALALPENKKIGTFTERQRVALEGRLRRDASRRPRPTADDRFAVAVQLGLDRRSNPAWTPESGVQAGWLPD